MTILEVLAVILILGLIATTLTISLSGRVGRAKHELLRSQIGRLQSQVESFKMLEGEWPSAGDGLDILTTPAADPEDPYFVEPGQLRDPWGRKYRYRVPGPDGRPFEILSYGADGQPGGTDADADISSAEVATGED